MTELRAGLVPLDRDLVARFIVRRGTILVPAALLDYDDGDEEADYRLRRFIAQRLPEPDPRATMTTSRRPVPGSGDVVIAWRTVRTVVTPAGHGSTPDTSPVEAPGPRFR